MCDQREVRPGLTSPERHSQRVENKISTQVAGELPADNLAGEHVDDEAEEHRPFPAAQVREIAYP